ncbi:RHS repeat protein [Oceanicoccus sagamiensis]|uniref:Teneurin-like YD-shell domain-containing protein n=1 Tax=Oceanicoccus sagamiensis TaxID=716816 RepID=A0A1X9NIX9_9GAMM|nr:RHS repeat protein [Oceanicoccus sagamiensis]ARN73943.1 hypothetical protein BST96_07330 [Oceanicoccus sagamiensis]
MLRFQRLQVLNVLKLKELKELQHKNQSQITKPPASVVSKKLKLTSLVAMALLGQSGLVHAACDGWNGPDGSCGESAYTLAKSWCDAEAASIGSDIGEITVWSTANPVDIQATCGLLNIVEGEKRGVGIRHAAVYKRGEFYNDDDKDNDDCSSNAQQASSSEKAGNPINIRTGVKTQIENDITAPVGSELGVTRHYSRSEYTDAQWRWHFAYSGKHLNLRELRFLLPCPGINTSCTDYDRVELYIDAHQQNGTIARLGSAVDFVDVPSDTTGQDVYKLFNPQSTSKRRGLSASFNDSANRWELSNHQGTEYYNIDGKFIGAKKNNGYHYTITLESNGEVDRVDDSAGHWLDYTFGQDPLANNYGKIEFIESSTGEVVHYTYDASGRLTHAGYGEDKNNLAAFVYRQYHYEDPAYTAGLTGITDENNQRYANWTYANFPDEGWAGTSSSHGSLGALSYQDLVTALADPDYSNTNLVDFTAINYSVEGTSGADATQVINPLGKKTQYEFTVIPRNGHIDERNKGFERIKGVETTSCARTWEKYEYDSYGYIKTKTRKSASFGAIWSDERVTYINDENGLPLTITTKDSLGPVRTVKNQWNAARQITDETVGTDGNVTNDTVHTHYEYLPNSRLSKKTVTDLTNYTSPYASNGKTRTWDYSYTYWDAEQAQLKNQTVDGPRTDVADIATFEYNTHGQLIKSTNALGHVTQVLEHSPHGHPGKIIDANGVETRMGYTFRGWLETVTIENGTEDVVTTLTYDDVGLVTGITLPNGSSLQYHYDSAHRLYQVTDSSGASIEYTLDNAGNRIAEVIKDSGGLIVKSQTQVFDELSRLQQTLGANNQSVSYEYDLNDNPVTTIDGKAKQSSASFDGFDRLTEQVDRSNYSSQYSYDTEGRITSVTDQRGLITTYQYDGLGNLMQVISPDSGTTTYTYDAAGNRLSQTDARGVVALYTYDALNRLTNTSYPANSAENISYSYDDISANNKGIGRMTSVSDETGSSSYQYDFMGNVVNKTTLIGSIQYTTEYNYNSLGQVSSMTYPSGRIVHYSYDSLGRATGISTQQDAAANIEPLVSAATYLPFGGLTSYTFGNGIVQNLSYDQDYRLNSSTAQGTVNPLELTYSYDLNNNVGSIADVLNGANDQSFVYDANDRLQQAVGEYGQLDYQYDGVGNRTQKTTTTATQATTETYHYSPNSNQLNHIDSAGSLLNPVRIFHYDAKGNLTKQNTANGRETNYVYNEAGRYVQLDLLQNLRVLYSYNALGQRVTKTAIGGAPLLIITTMIKLAACFPLPVPQVM